MKNRTASALLALLAGLSAGQAQADGHYVAGVEGVDASSVPPPGKYYLAYLVNYNVDEFRAPGSSTALPGHNTATIAALANRFVWITDTKLLGADYGVEAIVPLLRTSLTLNAAGVSDSRSGVGDIYLGPLVLGWHGPRWDAVAAAGLWLDTATQPSATEAAQPGKGYKSTMLTGGLTYHIDAAKTASASALMRCEINASKDNGFQPGNQVSLEWGVGKAVGPVKLGLVGYDQWQVSTDSGAGASGNKSSRHAIGAEVTYPLMRDGVILKAALYKEYSAEGGTGPEPKGSMLRLSLVKFL